MPYLKRLVYGLVVWYLGIWAKVKLAGVKPIIIGVTGSVGKSSCVYLLNTILSTKFKTKTTFHGNSEIGLPLEILGLRKLLKNNSPFDWLKILLVTPGAALFGQKDFELLVAEMGVDEPFEPKNMSYLLKIVQPRIGVLLSVAPVHTEQFMAIVESSKGNLEKQLLEKITQEKGLLVTTLAQDGTAVVNIGSPYIRELISQIKVEMITVGETADADFRLLDCQLSLQGSQFKVKLGTDIYTIKTPKQLLFREFAITLLSALAVAKKLNFSIKEVISIIESRFEMPPSRQTILDGKMSSVIIDSSYNCSPKTVEIFLETVGQLKVKGKKILVLGDMRELGELTISAHQQAAHQAARIADFVITVGPLMKEYFFPELVKSGFPKSQTAAFLTAEGVGQFIVDQILSTGDLVLVKGSQNTIYLEEVVKQLLADPRKADQLLCRQSDHWEKVRAKFFKKNPNQRLA